MDLFVLIPSSTSVVSTTMSDADMQNRPDDLCPLLCKDVYVDIQRLGSLTVPHKYGVCTSHLVSHIWNGGLFLPGGVIHKSPERAIRAQSIPLAWDREQARDKMSVTLLSKSNKLYICGYIVLITPAVNALTLGLFLFFYFYLFCFYHINKGQSSMRSISDLVLY